MRAIWKGIQVLGLAAVFGLGAAVLAHAPRAYAFSGPDAMSGHMAMTAPRPEQPGDRAKADAVVAVARRVAEQYVDYRKALADGYQIFMPEMAQPVYHFIREDWERDSRRGFDASKPPALIYQKTGTGDKTGYKLVGVMYMAQFRASEEALNERIPLSIAQWHMHTNICMPPPSSAANWIYGDKKFGVEGSITTEAACTEAGGFFIPHLSGWMVHVYPFETDAAKIWKGGMDDDHLMQHSAMPGMQMAPGQKM